MKVVLSLAAVVLVALKLAGEIGWPWLLVFAPVWVPAVFLLGLRIGLIAVAGALVYLVATGGEGATLGEVMARLPFWPPPW